MRRGTRHYPPEMPAVPLLFAKRNFLSASLTSRGMSTVRDYDMSIVFFGSVMLASLPSCRVVHVEVYMN
jgi:hypothetical protein